MLEKRRVDGNYINKNEGSDHQDLSNSKSANDKRQTSEKESNSLIARALLDMKGQPESKTKRKLVDL